jgi:hypothetical protein
MTLHDLAVKYGTDKLQHGYIPFYEMSLPKEPKRILEIGVKEGASLGVWAEYFPNAEIHGLDLFIENEIRNVYYNIDRLSEGKLKFDRFTMHQGNQCDWQILELLRNLDFDVIIDDGSHNSRDQLMTFFGLYNGKHYFIEDLQCNDEEFYSQGLPASMRAANIFRGLPINGIVKDCQSPIVLISNL